MTFVDLSWPLSDGMPGFPMATPDGRTALSASVEPFVTHDETSPHYAEGTSFEITDVAFQSAVGTYLDAPAHRFPGDRDVADISLSELIAPGVVVDARDVPDGEPLGPDALPDRDLSGAAVLFEFGWDERWGEEEYYESFPYPSMALVDRLVEAGVSLVGVDTANVDDPTDAARPAHTRLLSEGVLIVENLRNLSAVRGRPFRFFAVPVRVEGAVEMPVRAFAEL